VANWVFAQTTHDVGRTSELDLLLGYRVKINVHQQRPSIRACIFITVHKGIVNRHFQAEFAKSDKNLHIIKNFCIGSNQILYNDKDREMVLVGFPNAHNKSKMADSCHIIDKQPYLGNSLTYRRQIWRDDAY